MRTGKFLMNVAKAPERAVASAAHAGYGLIAGSGR
jgi:hypothetical protein